MIRRLSRNQISRNVAYTLLGCFQTRHIANAKLDRRQEGETTYVSFTSRRPDALKDVVKDNCLKKSALWLSSTGFFGIWRKRTAQRLRRSITIFKALELSFLLEKVDPRVR